MKRSRAWLLLILLIPAGWWLYHRLMPQSRIVFVSQRSGHYEFYSMNADGGNVKQLTWPSEHQGQAPIFCPATQPGQLPLSNHSGPSESPDGKLIAFEVDVGGISQLFLVDKSGGNVRQLTHEALSARHPSFSPDGQQIAYDVGTYEFADICTIHINGRGRKALTHNHGIVLLGELLSHFGQLADRLHLNDLQRDCYPAWAPNPRH